MFRWSHLHPDRKRGVLIILLIVLAGVGIRAAEPREARESLQILLDQADKGDLKSIYQLGRLYDMGYDTIPRDTVYANKLYLKAAKGGMPAAENIYGYRLYNGIGMPANRRDGLDWIERAAMQGDITAASNLGWILLEGEGVYHDEKKAAYWFGRAAEAGMPQAQSMLGDLYITGRGVERDSLRAEILYTEAINGGLGEVQIKLWDLKRKEWESLSPEEAVEKGLGYYNGRAPYIGVRLFEQAAESGNARAHALLGDSMTRARGKAYDHDKAIGEYLKGARLGNASAQFVIGELLEIFPDALRVTGEEIEPEENTAIYWLDKATESGITNAEEATRKLLY